MSDQRPAWSRESAFLQMPELPAGHEWSPEWAMGGSTGAGVRVAVVDSGIQADHPALGGCIDVAGGMDFTVDAEGSVVATPDAHDDVYGHGTACAGIIHALAPEASITSIRVLGPGLRGKAAAFHAGLQWAVEQGFDVINLSLGAGKRDWAFPFHEVCDRGYFANSFIVTAANNIQRTSFPSLYASVTSVACNTTDDPLRYHFNPEPPTEFLARGIDVKVPWLGGETTVTTGNSFAAPHISGFAALIKSKHPNLRPFHVKALLWACAANVRDSKETFEYADASTKSTQHFGRGTMSMVAPAPLPQVAPAETADAASSEALAAAMATVVRPAAPSLDAHQPTKRPETNRPEALIAEHLGVAVSGVLAAGAWGTVYAAERPAGEALAVRWVEQVLVGDDSLADRFTANVRSAATLNHPHVLPIEELVELDDAIMIAMPRAQSNLSDMPRPVGIADACMAAISLLTGLEASHHYGVFHGDVRFKNSLIDHKRRVVVSDVGLAATLQANARTIVGFDASEWTHRAPEMITGGAVGAHTDVYSVGSMLYEMLAGRPPRQVHGGMSELITAATVATTPDPLPSTVPEQIATSVMYSLVHDPAYRWGSVADFAASLQASCYHELGSGWAHKSQFILESSQGSPARRQSGAIVRTFGN